MSSSNHLVFEHLRLAGVRVQAIETPAKGSRCELLKIWQQRLDLASDFARAPALGAKELVAALERCKDDEVCMHCATLNDSDIIAAAYDLSGNFLGAVLLVMRS